jgi:RND family efflux transporter MFP subunit
LNYDTYVSSAEDDLDRAQTAYDNAVISARNALATAKLTARQKITAAESKVDTTLEAWQVAQAQLNKIVAPPNKYDIALSRAKIRQAQATLDAVNKQIDNSLIVAPINGTITKIEYEIGEQVTASIPVISMLGENHFEIDVDISEADIAKVEKDNTVEITLDAFGDDIKFQGQVYFIEPAETVIQDVIYYKVNISFDPKKETVKSGMTANVIITTAEKDNVLIIPSRAVVERNGGEKYARVLADNQVEEKPIEVGLRGDEGMIEIISGIKEGEEVVTFIKEK